MLDIYYTFGKVASDDFIKYVLQKYYNKPNASLRTTINGKPYLKGDKIHFNLTHSKGLVALAVGKKQVGFDCESLAGKARPAVLSKFTERERAEIHSTTNFYAHWTARESYVKFLGETLAASWRKIEFVQGKIYFSGKETGIPVTQFETENTVFSICGDYQKYNIRKIDFPLAGK